MTTVIFTDCETGGLDSEHDALLSVGLVEWVDGRIGETCEILVDPDGLRCTPKAMEVNRIDLDIHCAYSLSRVDTARAIRDWCKPRGRAPIGGHNVAFDIGFLQRLFAPGMWSFNFGHYQIDTMQVLAFLGHAGLIPPGLAKLDQAIAHFGISIASSKRHTALADAIAAAQVYTAALELMKRSVNR